MRHDGQRGSPPWNWHNDADDVVVLDQPPVACYVNPKGAVVLRQRDDWPSDDDSIIWFAPEHAAAVARAIMAAADFDPLVLTPDPARSSVKPKSASGAERQRRYRNRKRKETPTEPDIFGSEDRDTITRDVTRDGNGA